MTRNVVWFQLVDGDGNAMTSASCVDCAVDATVSRFRCAVKEKYKDTHLAEIDASELTVFANGVALDPRASLGPVDEDERLIVQMPKKQQQRVRWLVTGIVVNVRAAKGVRSRLYRLADSNHGFYDSSLRSDGSDRAIWYEETALRAHILFQTEEHALHFKSQFLRESEAIDSPLYGYITAASVSQVLRKPSELHRIFLTQYVAQDSDSPRQTMSFLSTMTSVVDVTTDEFRYQRIEAEDWFGSLGMAESCLLVSAAHCRKHETFKNYDRDPNNRLALSREMHGFYNGLNMDVPVMNIFYESSSPAPVVDDRYEVKLIVRAVNRDYGERIASRLKEGSTFSIDGMEMRTSVFVKQPHVFRQCLEWKSTQIEKIWKDFFGMTPGEN